MESQDELKKWYDLLATNKHLKRSIKKLNKNDLNKNGFFEDIKIMNDFYYGKFDIGYNNINPITVKKIIDNLVFENENNKNVLISSDGSIEGKQIIDWILRHNNKKINFFCYSDLQGFDRKFISSCIKKIKATYCVHICKTIYKKNIFSIYVFDNFANKLKKEELKNIYRNIEKNTNEIKIQENSLVSFLNNEALIKSFIDKISKLFIKDSNDKKIKIAISNRSDGITNILSKLIGSQDFSYIINNKIKNKDINFLNYKKLTNKEIKRFFKSEIFYAKSNRANMIVAFNQEGSQLFIFLINGTKIHYLNEDLISEIFLYKFYNDLGIENKKLPNIYISSNKIPNENLLQLIKNYKINFKRNLDNNFNNQKEYLLLYWNDYNQFIFGEKTNDEFTIYHLLIKLISILNYYINQYNSPNALFNKLIKMYGDFVIEEKFIKNFSYTEIKNKIDVYLNEEQNQKNIINQKLNNEFNEETVDNIICEFETNKNYKILIKHNKIMNKTIIVFQYIKNYYILKLFLMNNFEKRRFIKKLLK